MITIDQLSIKDRINAQIFELENKLTCMRSIKKHLDNIDTMATLTILDDNDYLSF